MIETMDMDLLQWHLPASIGVDCGAEFGWEFDSDFCNVPDILEENAINEKCCIQALNHLIAKADAEIFDLEDDLAILNSQLSWAKHVEHEKLYEIWCASFREKITSLSRSLQTSTKESAPDNHALNADSGINHAPIERIHDIIFALLEHNFPKENRKECRIIHADIEVREKTTAASASLGLSRKLDNIVGTENQPMIDKIREEKDLHIPDVRLTEKHGQAFERERPTISMPDCNKVSDNEIKDGSFALQGEKGTELIPFQQNFEETDELDPTLRADPRWPSVKVEFDEHEPLIMFLSSHGSKRKKFQSNPARSRTKVPEEGNRKKLCMNDTGGAAIASSMRKPASEGSGRKFGVDRKSAKGKLPLHVNENSIQNSGPARGARSLISLSIEIKSSSMSSHSADLQGDTVNSPLEKHTQETTISESTISKLEKMNREELRAMAKKYGLKRYHKLKKSLLVDIIVRHLSKKLCVLP